MKFFVEVANMWYDLLLEGFCEDRKIELSLEPQGFQRFGKISTDKDFRSPKAGALHPGTV